MRSLVPLRKSTTAASVAQSGGGVVLAGTTPPIALALTKVLVAFAAPAQGDLDMQLVFSVYCEAIEGIPESVVLYALKRLQTKNPRNPFRPSPQDVYEACQARLKELKAAVVDYFESFKNPWPEALGEAPFEPGCVVPRQIALEAVRRMIDVHRIRRDTPDENTDGARRIAEKMYELISQARFNRIPAEAFATLEEYDGVVARMKEVAERVEAWVKHQTYLDTLEPDLLIHREKAIITNWHWRCYRAWGTLWQRNVPSADVEAEIISSARRGQRIEQATQMARQTYDRENSGRCSWGWALDGNKQEYIHRALAELGCTKHGDLVASADEAAP